MSRSVSLVSEDKDELPVIESVGWVDVTTVSNTVDPFKRKAEELKSFSGISSVAKRRATNEIKKYHRGDGAESKKIEGNEYFSGYDMFEVVLPPYNLDNLTKLYEISPIHYAAVNAKVANIVGLGYNLVESNRTKRAFERMEGNQNKVKNARRRLEQHKEELEETIDSWNEEDTFTETLVKAWRDYETTGNGYLEVGRKRDGTIGYVGHIPSKSMRIRKRRDGFVQISGSQVQFFRNFGDTDTPNPIAGNANGSPNEVIHFKKYSPTSSYYGIPDIISAQNAVAGNEFAAKFNLDYFENKAVPRYVITLKGAKLGTRAEADLLQFFETSLKGTNHRTLYIPLPPDTQDNKVEMKFEAIEANIQDSSFNNYRKSNLQDIAMAHRVPLPKLGVVEGVSLAASRDADKTFKEQVCGPEQSTAEKKVNRIIREFTDAFDFSLNEMTLTDEDTQSKIDERRRKTGTETANEQRTRRGMPAIEGGDELVDLNASAKIAERTAEANTERQRDAERSAGATDSAGEGRNAKGDGRTTT